MHEPDWEDELAAAWATLDDVTDDAGAEAFRRRVDEVAAHAPYADGTAAFERASAWDSTGHSDRAVPLYEEALGLGLTGLRRRRATVQLASSLRNMGRPEESAALLATERDRVSDELDDAVAAFLALALADLGRAREAASLALGALAPHLARYQQSLGRYARALVEPDDD